jgi:hypothetical protein
MRGWLILGGLLASSVVFLGNIPGCGPCYEERVEARMPATVTVNGTGRSVVLSGRVGPGNIGSFASFRQAVTHASTTTAPAVAWTLDQCFETQDFSWRAMTHDLPVSVGEVIPVRTTVHGGGWGVVRDDVFPPGERVLTFLKHDDFLSRSVNGTLRVLDTTPLELRVDVQYRNAAGDTTITVRGDLAFRAVRERVACD